MEKRILIPMSLQTNVSDNHTARVLVADDQADVREALRLVLKPEGFVVDGRLVAGRPYAKLAVVCSVP